MLTKRYEQKLFVVWQSSKFERIFIFLFPDLAHLKSLSLAFLVERKSLKHRPETEVCKFNETSIYVIVENLM